MLIAHLECISCLGFKARLDQIGVVGTCLRSLHRLQAAFSLTLDTFTKASLPSHCLCHSAGFWLQSHLLSLRLHHGLLIASNVMTPRFSRLEDLPSPWHTPGGKGCSTLMQVASWHRPCVGCMHLECLHLQTGHIKTSNFKQDFDKLVKAMMGDLLACMQALIDAGDVEDLASAPVCSGKQSCNQRCQHKSIVHPQCQVRMQFCNHRHDKSSSPQQNIQVHLAVLAYVMI